MPSAGQIVQFLHQMATIKDFLTVEKMWNADGTRPPSSAHVARIEPLSVQRANVCKNRAILEPCGTRAILQGQNQGKNHPKSAHKKPWNTHGKRIPSVSHAAHQMHHAQHVHRVHQEHQATAQTCERPRVARTSHMRTHHAPHTHT